MKTLSTLLCLSVLAIAMHSCKKSPPEPQADPNIKFTSVLTGAQEVPANASTATADVYATFNVNTKLFAVLVTYNNFSGTPGGNVHKGAVGVNGAVVTSFTSLGAPQVLTHLDAAQEADLMANGYYVNITSAAYPAGEIRGQLLKQ